MASRSTMSNSELNSHNSLTHLIDSISPNIDNEINLIEQSKYYSSDEFNLQLRQLSGKLTMLSLNCQSLNAKFDNLKLFLSSIDSNSPITLIVLQETWFKHTTDLNYFNIPDYTMISDYCRLSQHGGLVIYVHNSFTAVRSQLNPNSNVFESMLLEIHPNHSKFNKYIIGNIYRVPSGEVTDLTTFIDEFSILLHTLQQQPYKTYMLGDYNIDLLRINSVGHYNNFYENVSSLGFFPKITRPTRLSNTLAH